MLRIVPLGAGIEISDGVESFSAFADRAVTNSRATTPIVRDFKDPHLELIELLQGAAEIEQMFLIQYLYAAFSVSPRYPGLQGGDSLGSGSLLGVSIQEMRHFSYVNQFLVELGVSPKLVSIGFPYRSLIYPFEFNLEPLSRKSLAKYVYAEAPAEAVSPDKIDTDPFVKLLYDVLGHDARPNGLGSLYDTILGVIRELLPGKPELQKWIDTLTIVKDEGEMSHFEFFKGVFTGTNAAFEGNSEVWSLDPTDPNYPAIPLPVNPSAYLFHERQILDPGSRNLAWLSNLHYWVVLILLDLYFRSKTPDYLDLAEEHMRGPLLQLGRFLAKSVQGVPFDPMVLSVSPGLTTGDTFRILRSLIYEAQSVSDALGENLPPSFDAWVNQDTLETLTKLEGK